MSLERCSYECGKVRENITYFKTLKINEFYKIP